MTFKSLKILLFSAALFLIWPIVISQANDSDAIGIRIIPNPDNLSISRWYADQGFSGSPQAITIDSYPAIRDGRTVYVNVANIKDNSLYTDILLISYNQDSSSPTVDIFGQIVKNLKFNSNIEGNGNCSLSKQTSCFYDGDCPLGEYCNSLKARVIRDVKRLEGLSEIKRLLSIYKSRNDSYPKLLSGTYVSGITISTWPSWQKTLAIELGGPLPIDPINKMGACPGFATTTCWNETTKRFAGDLTKKTLPQGTSAYVYYADPQGSGWGTCVQTESGYSNLRALNCFADQYSNNPPVFKDVNLSGFPGQEFYGFAWGLDSDGDKMTLQAELFNPNNSSAWQSGGWEWDAGNSGFKVTPSNTPGQFTLHAATVGRYLSGYQVKLTLDDGRNLPNSRQSQTYPVNIGFGESVLSDSSGRVAIGNSLSLKMFGQDVDGSALTSLNFKSAFLGEKELNKTQWEQMGFSLKEMSLSGIYKPSQKTGNYIVNVSSKSPLGGKDKLAAFRYSVYNTPPVFKELVASFPDGSGVGCQNDCSINVYNGEKATVKIVGVDSENHNINYELVDNLGGKISINKSSGLITGLEKLDSGDESFKTFTVKLKMFDDYCASSSEQECSSLYSFDIVARQVCSSDNPKSFLKAKANGPFKVTQSGQKLNMGLVIPDCGEILGNTSSVKFIGVTKTIDRNQAIVIVSDTSASMQTNVEIDSEKIPAITRLQKALVDEGGLLDSIYKFASTTERVSQGLFVKIGMFQYSWTVYSKLPISNIFSIGFLDLLKTYVSWYGAYGSTDTLKALNEAEVMLDSVNDANTEKIVILISDGIPTIDKTSVDHEYYCEDDRPPCPCFLDSDRGNCRDSEKLPKLEEGLCKYRPVDGDDKRFKYWSDSCGMDFEYNCYYGINKYETDKKDKDGNTCFDIRCYYPPSGGGGAASFNPYQKIKLFFASLFKIFETKAVTEHSACASVINEINQNIDCPSGYHRDYKRKNYSSSICNSAADVSKQASLMKEKGITIYTIYYNTQATEGPKQNMCSWSSNNGINCDRNLYAFSGQNIDEMMKKLSSNLTMNKPKDVKVNGVNVSDPDASSLESSGVVSIDGLTCSNLNPAVTYINEGSLEFSNIEIDYCPVKKRLN